MGMPEMLAMIWVAYCNLARDKDKLILRHNNTPLEKFLVGESGYTPVGDRWQ